VWFGGKRHFQESKLMEAIILAGGFGTRLRLVVPDCPKPMAPIAGRPFLEILLGSLSHKGFKRVVLSLGFMASKIVAHFGDHFAGMEIVYVIEDSPLGTGGAVRLAMDQCKADHLFVFNGDTFLDLEVGAVEQQWRQCHHPIMLGREVPDTARYGRLIIEQGHVIGFTEKGVTGPGIINAGCYVFDSKQLASFEVNTAFSLETDYLAKAVSQSTFDLFVTTGQFIDIGVPEDFLRAQTELAKF
jgi:D-glycero-alpha-D-manno-heptose 1-phosphate guanylyltransferase